MSNITDIMGGDFTPPPEPKKEYRPPPSDQLLTAIAESGITPPHEIVFDGKIHRFSSSGKKRDDSGWYVAFDGKVHAARYGCWREHLTANWREDIGRKLSAPEEMEHAARMRDAAAKADAERKRKQETAAATVGDIWNMASEASDEHPYLQAKGVKSHGLKVSGDGRLIVPMINGSGEISSLQYIPADGDKRYHPGGEVVGCYYRITGHGDTVYVAEGYATAASVHEATGATVYVAFSAGQLSAVTGTVRSDHPGDLVIVADNDESGTGQASANKAATEHKARVIMPPAQGMDANDYAQAGHDLAALLQPPADDWLISADDFASKPAPIRWLIKHHVQREALHMVHGPSGGGKTFMVLDQCLSVAAGLPDWCGHKVRPGMVVYLAGEGHHGLRGRVAAWKQYNSVTSLNMWLSRAGTDLNTPAGYEKVRSAVMALPEQPVMIVVDTLHRFLDGDENSAQDAKTMLDACNGLMREFECSVMLVHHTGVSDEAQHRARGSSAWKGALDIEVSVIPGTDDAPMQVVQRKMKDGEMADPIAMRITPVELPWEDEDGEPVTSAVVLVDEDWTAPDNRESESHAAARQCFESAWILMGDYSMGAPYLTESAFREFHRSENHDKKTDTIRKAFSRYRKALVDSGFLSESGAGFVVSDPISASAIIAIKNRA